jgi:TM2 domain-containing membrane protein YozV
VLHGENVFCFLKSRHVVYLWKQNVVMKKLLVLIAVLFAGVQLSFASSYKLDALALETKFASAQELKISEIDMTMLTQQTQVKSEVSRIAAAVIGVFCGTLGIHRFYMGHTNAGIVYLVVGVVTAGTVTSVVGLIDGIIYLLATDEEFTAKYLHNDKIIQWI